MALPKFNGKISIFYSAIATFHSPSDVSGITGMHWEHIQATPSWRNKTTRYDCTFVNSNPVLYSMCGLEVACVMTFFSFVHEGKEYLCALIHWFSHIGNTPNEDTGMWEVEPSYISNKSHLCIIHIDMIYCAAHLIPVYQTSRFIAQSLTMNKTLNTFNRFYVNKFVDHHAFVIAS